MTVAIVSCCVDWLVDSVAEGGELAETWFGAARKLFFLPSRPDVDGPITDGAIGSSPASSTCAYDYNFCFTTIYSIIKLLPQHCIHLEHLDVIQTNKYSKFA